MKKQPKIKASLRNKIQAAAKARFSSTLDPRPSTLDPRPSTAAHGVGESKRVPLGSIVVTRNVRREFDIAELRESIREQGIVQPLIVRPRPTYELHEPDLASKSWRVTRDLPGEGARVTVMEFPEDGESNAKVESKEYFDALPKGDYELVAGERRLRCARELKLKEVPVLVRALSDAQAREIQLIENLQREGLSHIDEAQGYADAIASKDYGEGYRESVAALAAKVSRSPSHISNRLALLKLGEGGRAALSGGKLDLSIALLVASIPGEEKQQEAMKEIQKPEGWRDEPMTHAEAKEYIEDTFRRSLKGAPFDGEDAALYPEAGVCSKCAFRLAPNVCTNTPCYERKTSFTIAAKAAAYEKKGRTVLVDKKPEDLFQESGGRSYLRHGTGYTKATETCYEDPKGRSFKELLGQSVAPVLAFDHQGHAVELYPEKGMNDLIRAAGHKFLDQKKEKKKADNRAEQLELAVNRELLTEMLGLVQEDKHEKNFLITLLSKQLEHGSLSRIFKRRGEPDIEPDEKWYESLTVAQLRSYLLERSLLDYDGEYWDAPAVAEQFGVKVNVIQNRVETRLKAEANAKKEENHKDTKVTKAKGKK